MVPNPQLSTLNAQLSTLLHQTIELPRCGNGIGDGVLAVDDGAGETVVQMADAGLEFETTISNYGSL